MDITSELDVYKFLQLINDDDSSDKGTELFVKHLFAIGKLKFVKALYGKETIVKNNEDIPYIVALETILEKFSDKFDAFIRENSSKVESKDEARDMEATAKGLISEISVISKLDISKSLETTFSFIAPHIYTICEYLDKLRAYKFTNGLKTNIKDSLEFFYYRSEIRVNRQDGKYIVYIGK